MRARVGVRQVEPLAGARDRHVRETALLLEPRRVEHRVRVREDRLLESGDEHDRVLEALGGVHGHERDVLLALGERVEVGAQREPLHERGQVGRLVVLGELGDDAEELADVVGAAEGLVGALGFERLDEAGARDDHLDEVAQVALHASAARRCSAMKPASARLRARLEAVVLDREAQRVLEADAALARASRSTRSTVVPPMLRLGVLMMRLSEISSAGFTTALR